MIARVQIGFYFDTSLPRDVVTMTPHFNTDAPQALCDQLKTNIIASVTGGNLNWFTIKAYDARLKPPSYPVATAQNVVVAPGTSHPREVALCLSYYSTYNRPSYRGRLYIPGMLVPGAQGLRPTTVQQQSVLDFAKNVLTKSLPQGTNWVVYSKIHDEAYGVSDYWCDDEWDTVRSRGMKATSRLTAKVP